VLKGPEEAEAGMSDPGPPKQLSSFVSRRCLYALLAVCVLIMLSLAAAVVVLLATGTSSKPVPQVLGPARLSQASSHNSVSSSSSGGQSHSKSVTERIVNGHGVRTITEIGPDGLPHTREERFEVPVGSIPTPTLPTFPPFPTLPTPTFPMYPTPSFPSPTFPSFPSLPTVPAFPTYATPSFEFDAMRRRLETGFRRQQDNGIVYPRPAAFFYGWRR